MNHRVLDAPSPCIGVSQLNDHESGATLIIWLQLKLWKILSVDKTAEKLELYYVIVGSIQ